MFAKIFGPDNDQIVVMIRKTDSTASVAIYFKTPPNLFLADVYEYVLNVKDYEAAVRILNETTEESLRLRIKTFISLYKNRKETKRNHEESEMTEDPELSQFAPKRKQEPFKSIDEKFF